MGEGLDLDKIKRSINNMLWTTLPGNTTLKEAEIIAMEIFQVFVDFEEKMQRINLLKVEGKCL
jgi:hypothetical protein